jgi:hypothetical protein
MQVDLHACKMHGFGLCVNLQQVRAELDRHQRALQAALILERLQDVADRIVSWILPVSANPRHTSTSAAQLGGCRSLHFTYAQRSLCAAGRPCDAPVDSMLVRAA